MTDVKHLLIAALIAAGATAAGLGLQEFGQTTATKSIGNPNDVTVAGDKAPIYHAALAGKGDRRIDQSRIESSSVVTHVEVIGGAKDARIVLLDPEGNVIYETDPTSNTTVVARDVVVPSVTVRSGPEDTAELRIVSAAPPKRAPLALAEALENGERINADIFYRGDL